MLVSSQCPAMTRARLFVFCLVLALVGAEVLAEAEAPEEARISYEGAQLLRVEAPTIHDKDEILKLADIGVLETWSAIAQNGSQIDVFVKADAEFKVKQFLNDNNLTFEVVIENIQDAINTESPPLSVEEMDELVDRNGHRMTWQSYHRLDDIYSYLDYMAATFPSVSVQTIGTSLEGRPLKVLSISSGKPGAPAIWIDGGVHAREWISPASVTYIINELVVNRNSLDPIVKAVDFHILAVANPDGYEHSCDKDRLWRKNRRDKTQGSCAGVDLNRNFGYKWGGAGSSKQPCKEIYAGSSAFSEPETKAMSSFVLSKSVKGYLSFHSYGQYILYPWGYDRVVPPDYRDLQRVGKAMGQAMQALSNTHYTVGSAATTLYPASGGSDDWAKGTARIKYTYTVELRDKGRFGFVLPAHLIIPTAKEALAGVLEMAKAVAEA